MKQSLAVCALAVGLLFGRLGRAQAHCDTMDGPVVAAAKAALAKGDVTPVLRWVKQEHEDEIRDAFAQTLAVRAKGPDARRLADNYFFETLVRIHRAGEGAPFTGLKPAKSGHETLVEQADKALEAGKVDSLIEELNHLVAAGVRERFARASAKRSLADTSVRAGREAVEAYVTFVHYVAAIGQAASAAAEHAGPSENHETPHQE